MGITDAFNTVGIEGKCATLHIDYILHSHNICICRKFFPQYACIINTTMHFLKIYIAVVVRCTTN